MRAMLVLAFFAISGCDSCVRSTPEKQVEQVMPDTPPAQVDPAAPEEAEGLGPAENQGGY